MRLSLPLLLFSLLFCAVSLAADIRFIGSEQAINLRGGPGEDYPIVYRGIAPTTRLTVARTSDDGLWADVTADNGITGWIPTQVLVLELPEPPKPTTGAKAVPVAVPADAEATGQAPADPADTTELRNRIAACDTEFNTVAQELHQLKQVSGKAVQLDIDNRRLVEEQENLRSEVEMLQAENQRLVDKLHSEDFMNGSLAVLLGVIIALVAPRLVPQRRKTSSWT
ncbi:MAG: TIGR04211 family SH3 domain-containing protein [Halioglobus sp.]